jgi:excisionase family DNA binding protein
MSVHDRLLSLKEAAEQLSVSPDFVRVRIRKGEIPSLRIGRLLKVRQSDLDTVKREGLANKPVGEAA